MSSKLKTDWKRIGRSGPTVDGRFINADDLREAAEQYNSELYTALIWPDHKRWYNFGSIEKVRVEDNDEGGIDLFAILKPNEFYLYANKQGQNLFTSMELQPDFRDTGKHYLTGLGATDSPASAATTEMRFSAIGEKNILLSEHIENTTHQFEDTEQPPNWFKQFFNKNTEADMSKEAIEKLSSELNALKKQFSALTSTETPNEEVDESKNFETLSKSVTALAERFTAFENNLNNENEDASKFESLQSALTELSEKFESALKETAGTEAGEESGAEDLNKYV